MHYTTKTEAVHTPFNIRSKASLEQMRPIFNYNSSQISQRRKTMDDSEKAITYRITKPVLYVHTSFHNKPQF